MKMIVAICKGGGIGFKNGIPWKMTKDMKHFKKLTIGNGNNAVIMGRKTWESLPKALPKRDNLILSQTLDGAFKSVSELEAYIKKKDYEDVWVIGGAQIYHQFFKKTTELHVTMLYSHCPSDTYFVDWDGISPRDPFRLITASEKYMENNIPFKFLTFTNHTKDYR
jgi:dihydrofolate reductase